jgi:hypothetical protein
MGFEVTKPDAWHYATAAQFFKNLNSVRPGDVNYYEQIKEYATTPVVAMMKFPEPYADVNPSFKINVRPYGEFKGLEATELLEMLLPTFEKTFRDFSVAQAPTYVEVSGIKSGYVCMTYTLEVTDGGQFPILSEVWIVPREHYFMIIGAGVRKDEKNGAQAEIAAILKTLRFY